MISNTQFCSLQIDRDTKPVVVVAVAAVPCLCSRRPSVSGIEQHLSFVSSVDDLQEDMSSSSSKVIVEDDPLLAEKVGLRLEELVLDLISRQELVSIGLSGGSMIDSLASIVPRLQLPWSRLRFFFVDERFVPFTSEESNFGNYQTKLFRQLPLTDKNVIKIDPNLASVEEVARDYEQRLTELFNGDNKVDDFFVSSKKD